jgi:hypothetical protein
MPDRATTIKKATLAARSSWLDYTVQQEAAIYRMFKDAAERIVGELHAATVAGKVPPARLTHLLNNLTAEVARLRPAFKAKIIAQITKSVDYGIKTGIKGMVAAGLDARYKVGIGTSYITLGGVVRRYDSRVQMYADSVWARINGEALDALIRFEPKALMFGQRVWDITWQAQKSISNAVNQAVALGKSGQQLSRDVRGFLVEPKKLYRRVRKDGRLVLSQAARDYRPGAGVYRSAYKNAMRMARTEMARAHYEGTVRYMAEKKWVDGGIWRLGNVEPCEICADLDGQFFEKGTEPMIPHPQCMCYMEPHIRNDPMPGGQHELEPDTIAATGIV